MATVTLQYRDSNGQVTATSPIHETPAGSPAPTVGRTVGTLTINGDLTGYGAPTLTTTDSRFEIVGGTLSVKAGVSFDFETTPGITLPVTVTSSINPNLSSTSDIGVSVVNEPDGGRPMLMGTPTTYTFVEGMSQGVNAYSNFDLKADNTLFQATVAIDNAMAGDSLSFTSSANSGNIVGVYSPTNATMTLSSANNTASLAEWSWALNSVIFTNTSTSPDQTPRVIKARVTDQSAQLSDIGTGTVKVVDFVTALTVAENTASTASLAAGLPDGAGWTLSLKSGGADNAFFTTDGVTLKFKERPDYENPLDSGKNNTYDVKVALESNGLGESIERDVTVTVTNTAETTYLVPDNYEVAPGNLITVPVEQGLLVNDVVPTGTTVRTTGWRLVDPNGGNNGFVQLFADGRLAFDQQTGPNGQYVLYYEVDAPQGQTAPAGVGRAVINVVAAQGASTFYISGSPVQHNEGNTGSTPFVFTVTRTSTGSETLFWRVEGGASPADGADFVGGVMPSGTVSFTGNETSKTITVNVAGDATVETAEGFVVKLSATDNGPALRDAQNNAMQGNGVITNDDAAPPPAADPEPSAPPPPPPAGPTGPPVIPPASTPPATAETVSNAISSLMQIEPGASIPSTVTLPNGTTVANPLLQQQALQAELNRMVAAGVLTPAQALEQAIDAVDGTTSVVTLSYSFFTGVLPTKAGIDFLVSSPGNPNDLNDGYYAEMSLENRYINMAVNLGRDGAGSAAFSAGYGSLSLEEAATKAYAEIFGSAPAPEKIAAILSAPVSFGGKDGQTRADYFAALGGSTLGAKAAMVGFLLGEAAKADAGPLALANEAFLRSAAGGTANYNVELVGSYGGATSKALLAEVDGWA